MYKLVDSTRVSLIGVSIYACRCSGDYLVAYEEDSTLFVCLKSSLCDLVSKPNVGASKPQIIDARSNEELVKKVARKI